MTAMASRTGPQSLPVLLGCTDFVSNCKFRKRRWISNLMMLSAAIFSICLLMDSAVVGVQAEESKTFHMQSVCKTHFLQGWYRKIEGAVLWSQNERNLDCIITFQTHSILQRFMLRFELLQLDCNDHLYIYDGAHAVGAFKTDLSCRNTEQSISPLFTRTNFVTLKYVTDGWGTDTNGFKMVVTAVKDPKHACVQFRCKDRSYCIDSNLVCDGVNHCADGSDEWTSKLCRNEETDSIMGMAVSWFVLVAVSTVLIVGACIVLCVYCVCQSRRNTTNSNMISETHQTIDSNGFLKQGQKQHMYMNKNNEQHPHQMHPIAMSHETTTIPMSGNLHHPAGPTGYRRMLRKKLMAIVLPTWWPKAI